MAQLDITQIESKLETTKENVSYISEIADKVVGAYTRSLDSLMQEIYKNVDSILEEKYDLFFAHNEKDQPIYLVDISGREE